MKIYFHRIISLFLILALSAELGAPALAASLPPVPAGVKPLYSVRLQQEALSVRALAARLGIPPFFQSFFGLFKQTRSLLNATGGRYSQTTFDDSVLSPPYKDPVVLKAIYTLGTQYLRDALLNARSHALLGRDDHAMLSHVASFLAHAEFNDVLRYDESEFQGEYMHRPIAVRRLKTGKREIVINPRMTHVFREYILDNPDQRLAGFIAADLLIDEIPELMLEHPLENAWTKEIDLNEPWVEAFILKQRSNLWRLWSLEGRPDGLAAVKEAIRKLTPSAWHTEYFKVMEYFSEGKPLRLIDETPERLLEIWTTVFRPFLKVSYNPASHELLFPPIEGLDYKFAWATRRMLDPVSPEKVRLILGTGSATQTARYEEEGRRYSTTQLHLRLAPYFVPGEIHTLRRPGNYLLNFAKKISWLPFVRSKFIPGIEYYRALHDQASAGESHELTETVRTSLQHRAAEITGTQIKIFPNDAPQEELTGFTEAFGYTPLIQVHRGQLLIKEAVFALRDREGLALLLGYGLALKWLMGFSWIPRLLRGVVPFSDATDEERLDFAAKLINVTLPFFYWQLRDWVDPLLETPPVTLEQILEAGKIRTEDEIVVKNAYRLAGRSYRHKGTDFLYPSGKSVFAVRTAAARDVAELGQGAKAIAAALLSELHPIQWEAPGPAERKALANDLAQSLETDFETAQDIQNLIRALHHFLHAEPDFNVEKPDPKLPDYRPQRYTDRVGYELPETLGQAYSVQPAAVLALWMAEKIETINTLDPKRERRHIEKFFFETQYVYLRLVERATGGSRLMDQLQKEAYEAYDPAGYLKSYEEFYDQLGLTPYQAETERVILHKRLEEILQTQYGLAPDAFNVFTRVKSFLSDRSKSLEESAQQGENGKPAPANGERQRDPVGGRIIVKSSEVLDQIRRSVPEALRTPERPIQTIPARYRIVRYHGRIVIARDNFIYPNPYQPGRQIPGELQIATEEGRHLLLSGHSPVKYIDYGTPHWEYTANRVLRILHGLETAKTEQPYTGVQFDHVDPLLSGDFNVDYQAYRNDLKGSINPRYSRHPKDLVNNNVNSIPWEKPVKLPANAVVADLIFHPDVGGFPDKYPQPYRMVVTPNPQEPGDFTIKPQSLELSDRLLPGDLIALDSAQIRGESFGAQERLYKKVATARAKLCLYPVLQNKPTLEKLAEDGRELMARQRYGDIEAASFAEHALPSVLHWLGVSKKELQQTFALAEGEHAHGSPAAFLRAKKDFERWYRERFVQLIFSEPRKIDEETYEILVEIDEDQVGIMADLSQIVRSQGWAVMKIEALRPRKGGADKVRLAVSRTAQVKDPDVEVLIRALKGLRRQRGKHQPVENGERVKIDVVFTKEAAKNPGLLDQLNRRLSKLNINVESQELGADAKSPLGSRLMSLVLVTPASFEKYSGVPLDEVLRLEFLAIPGLIEKVQVEAADYSEATVAEINRFLVSEAMRVDKRFWKFLTFHPEEAAEAGKTARHAEGKVDELAVERFIKMWALVKQFHPEQDNDLAKKQLRDNKAPYWVHLLGATWDVLNVVKERNPVMIHAEAGHDLFEDGVENILALSNEKGRPVSAEQAKEQIVKGLDEAAPSYIAGPVRTQIEAMTRSPGQPVDDFLHDMLKALSRQTIILKLPDIKNNLLDNDPRRTVRTVRYFLDFMTIERLEKDPWYRLARADLLRILLPQLAALDRVDIYYQDYETSPQEKMRAERQTLSSIRGFLRWTLRENGRRALDFDTGLEPKQIASAIERLEDLYADLQRRLTVRYEIGENGALTPAAPLEEKRARVESGPAPSLFVPSLQPSKRLTKDWFGGTLLMGRAQIKLGLDTPTALSGALIFNDRDIKPTFKMKVLTKASGAPGWRARGPRFLADPNNLSLLEPYYPDLIRVILRWLKNRGFAEVEFEMGFPGSKEFLANIMKTLSARPGSLAGRIAPPDIDTDHERMIFSLADFALENPAARLNGGWASAVLAFAIGWQMTPASFFPDIHPSFIFWAATGVAAVWGIVFRASSPLPFREQRIRRSA